MQLAQESMAAAKTGRTAIRAVMKREVLESINGLRASLMGSRLFSEELTSFYGPLSSYFRRCTR
jgi:hypothetical protein